MTQRTGNIYFCDMIGSGESTDEHAVRVRAADITCGTTGKSVDQVVAELGPVLRSHVSGGFSPHSPGHRTSRTVADTGRLSFQNALNRSA